MSPGSCSSPGGLVPNTFPRGQGWAASPSPPCPRFCLPAELGRAAEREKTMSRSCWARPHPPAGACDTARHRGQARTQPHGSPGGTVTPVTPRGWAGWGRTGATGLSPSRWGRERGRQGPSSGAQGGAGERGQHPAPCPVRWGGTGGSWGGLAEHRPPLRYPQHREAAGPARCPAPLGCPAPSGVPGSPCPFAPPAGPCTLGWLRSAPCPLPPQEATRRGGCGQEGSHPGDFLTLLCSQPPSSRLRSPGTPTRQRSPARDPLPRAGADGGQRGRCTAAGTAPARGGFAGSSQPRWARGWG